MKPAREISIPRPPTAPVKAGLRPQVRAKFVFVGNEKVFIRGVTYGTFRQGDKRDDCYQRDVVDGDFSQIAANGFNTVRTYTVPPAWFLDAAREHDLRVMVGLPWEQHVAFLDDKQRVKSIEERVRNGVRACAGHPAILGYAIGNEIPAPIVRWHGRSRVEHFIKQLYLAAKAEDPGGLVTYVNYPSTEYLQLRFLDFVSFNVYLEKPAPLSAYLARLQNIAGERPLVMSEVGLDSRRNGTDEQARALDWQIRTAFAAGCAGAIVFAWTDEWHRGGYDIEDWDFGLTSRNRKPKQALAAVRKAFSEVPFPRELEWPRISVVVCTHNGARTIRDCLGALLKLDYPNCEVIVVDDGSTDATPQIASEYPFRLIRAEHRGLSSARNTGLRAATGEIVAYLDDDAYPDPHWLSYFAHTFMNSNHAGVGGPNVAPAGDGLIAECVSNAPGGPVHVLLSDNEAEHIPGCNMAFRRDKLLEVGGFDEQFRVAGDDVDICWKLEQRGLTLGFSPSAMVWHHRRDSLRAYWNQQKGYGRAEALLEQKWPEKYNLAGHVSWAGRIYGKGAPRALSWSRRRVYHGTWGSSLFQSIYQPAQNGVWALPMMPEWYLIVFALLGLATLGLIWRPLGLFAPLAALSGGASLVQALISASKGSFMSSPRSRWTRLNLYALTTLLCLMQPAARLYGRIRYGLAPWRRRGVGVANPRARSFAIWSEQWQAPEDRLLSIETALRAAGAAVRRGGDYDAWDLEVQAGLLGATRLLMTTEEHGGGKQLSRFRSWPSSSGRWLALILFFAVLSVLAVLDQAWVAAVILGAVAMLLALRTVQECATTTATLASIFERQEAEGSKNKGRRTSNISLM